MDAASSSMDTRVQHLARVSLFSDCTDDELRRIADISRIAEAPAATRLTEAGAAGDSFFFIIDGRVSVETPIGAGGLPEVPGLQHVVEDDGARVEAVGDVVQRDAPPHVVVHRDDLAHPERLAVLRRDGDVPLERPDAVQSA